MIGILLILVYRISDLADDELGTYSGLRKAEGVTDESNYYQSHTNNDGAVMSS